MSLFGSMMGMGDFDDDMFMSNHPMNMMQMQMRNMNRMMSSLMPDPFNMLMPFDRQQGAMIERNNGQMGMNVFFGFPMPNMNRLLNADIGTNGGASFCSSSVISMSSGPDGRPQIYQATSSSKTGPGGVRETRKTVQDSTTGMKKMAIGHHIGDRAHIIEKEEDLRSGQLEERQEFINLEEEQAEDFDREFTNKANMGSSTHVVPGRGLRGREILTIEDADDDDDETPATARHHRRQLPALLPAPSTQSKRSTETASTSSSSSTSTQNATTSMSIGREPYNNNNNSSSHYASRRASAHRSQLGAYPRRALRTPASSPLALSPTPNTHHHNHHHGVPSAASGVKHPHPYKNAELSRRQRAKQNALAKQQQQQQQQQAAAHDDDDEPQVIIEEPDDD